MISWFREKVAERRAKWNRNRKQEEINTHLSCSSLEKQNYKIENNENTQIVSSSQNLNENLTVPSVQNGTYSISDINIRIFSTNGLFVDLVLSKLSTGFELKKEAMHKLNNVNIELVEPSKSSLYYVIYSKTKRKVDESLSLVELKLQDKDEFILCCRKFNVENEENLTGPKIEDIVEATKHIEPTNASPPIVNMEHLLLQNDIQFDIRKILISLAQSSAYVIGAGPYANRVISMLKLRLLNRRKHESDTAQCLIDMGFSKERTIYALRIHNNVYSAALEWLIENQGLADFDTSSLTEYSDSSHKICSKNTSRENIESLLEIIRIHAHRNIPPQKEMIKNLVEMGFSEENVIEALKSTRNNQAAACEWLVGIRSQSLTELREGLPTESPVLKSLLASPQIQISLCNPKVFLAYISMLENYSSISMWLSDNETSGILGHILRTYHEEKHIIAINQFSSILSG